MYRYDNRSVSDYASKIEELVSYYLPEQFLRHRPRLLAMTRFILQDLIVLGTLSKYSVNQACVVAFLSSLKQYCHQIGQQLTYTEILGQLSHDAAGVNKQDPEAVFHILETQINAICHHYNYRNLSFNTSLTTSVKAKI